MLFALNASAQKAAANDWKEKLDTSAAALLKGEYAASLRITERLIDDMVQALGPGPAATEFFGLTLTHKALAESGLGRNEDALWDWHTVLTIDPQFKAQRLQEFGAPGKFLMDNSVVRLPSQQDASDQKQRSAAGFDVNVKRGYEDAVPPRLKKRVNPRATRGAWYFGSAGTVQAEVIIDEKGVVTAPILVQRVAAPALNYVALEALRKWQFEPATVKGKPVATIFTLSMSFGRKR